MIAVDRESRISIAQDTANGIAAFQRTSGGRPVVVHLIDQVRINRDDVMPGVAGRQHLKAVAINIDRRIVDIPGSEPDRSVGFTDMGCDRCLDDSLRVCDRRNRPRIAVRTKNFIAVRTKNFIGSNRDRVTNVVAACRCGPDVSGNRNRRVLRLVFDINVERNVVIVGDQSLDVCIPVNTALQPFLCKPKTGNRCVAFKILAGCNGIGRHGLRADVNILAVGVAGRGVLALCVRKN